MNHDTICAIATALSASSIGIVRISGPDALSIADRIFISPGQKHQLSSMESHTVRYGFLFNGKEILDEVLLTYFKAPRSYTAEDVVEISTHGGVYVVKKALELIMENGARLAEPGEFTKRAFLNGRIDLTKAQAVMDIISSSSEAALKSSVSVLRGALYEKIRSFREILLHETAFIEAAIDDPEHYDLEGYPERLLPVINEVTNEISHMIAGYDNGKRIREGINTVILGKPNAGKSSLLNMLAGYDRAIVTDIPGTTRDVIEEKINIGELSLNVIDTAGIRNTEDRIEKMGIERTLQYSDRADLILYVADSSVSLDENDDRIFDLLREKKSVILYNKSDLTSVLDENELRQRIGDLSVPVIRTSAVTNEGVEELYNAILSMFFNGSIDYRQDGMISNLRQKEALQNALDSLYEVRRSAEDHMPEDFYSIDLVAAYAYLGSVIGESVEDDVVDKVFAEFCMGK